MTGFLGIVIPRPRQRIRGKAADVALPIGSANSATERLLGCTVFHMLLPGLLAPVDWGVDVGKHKVLRLIGPQIGACELRSATTKTWHCAIRDYTSPQQLAGL